jgi:hypothetical protein
VQVTGLTDVSAIEGGSMTSYAIHQSGAVSCWGYDADYNCGTGQLLGARTTPVTWPLSSVYRITSHSYNACAVKMDDTAACLASFVPWLAGTGDNIRAQTPMPVTGLVDAVAISSSYMVNCAAKSDGSVWCWGEGDGYLLGDGVDHFCTSTSPDTECSNAPVQVSGVTDAVDVAMVPGGSCAVNGDGTLSCWGAASPTGGLCDCVANQAHLAERTPGRPPPTLAQGKEVDHGHGSRRPLTTPLGFPTHHQQP